MKRWQIWLVGFIMTIAFSGLLWMQVNYLQTMARMRNQQFSEAVFRSLYKVSEALLRKETLDYLEADMLKEVANSMAKKKKKGTESFFYQEQYYSRVTTDPSGKVTVEEYIQNAQSPNVYLSPHHGKNNILATSKKFQNDLKVRYLFQKDQLDALILDILERSDSKPFLDRIDVRFLAENIKAELTNNGINLAFCFKILNARNQVIYSSTPVDTPFPVGEELFSQTLFSNDRAGMVHSINLYFPEKEAYIFESVRFMIPSFLLSIVLMLTFGLTIYMLFRQKRVSEMRTDFINNMTHEFKTPVSTISLAAQMLKDPAVRASDSMMGHVSRVIGDETKRLSFQVEKVLQMSMFDREKAMLRPQTIDLHEVIESVVSTFRLKVEQDNGGELSASLRAVKSYVYADSMHITNVLFNLMDNAVKYANPERSFHLTISTRNDLDKLIIEVEDNGIGMPKEHLRKIFDRFYRVPKGNVHNVKGFGLGLAYVKKIVSDHGGKIKAESEINRGAKFIISLPTTTKPEDTEFEADPSTEIKQ